jgi:hypothetical protein
MSVEEIAFRFLFIKANNLTKDDIEGLSLIKNAYHRHKDKSDVIENICHLLKDLCNYGK